MLKLLMVCAVLAMFTTVVQADDDYISELSGLEQALYQGAKDAGVTDEDYVIYHAICLSRVKLAVYGATYPSDAAGLIIGVISGDPDVIIAVKDTGQPDPIMAIYYLAEGIKLRAILSAEYSPYMVNMSSLFPPPVLILHLSIDTARECFEEVK